ncbi:ABC transporter permease [Paenibacillus woosongensis]|uniref:Putative hemin transport system permease protein HrtB n=1 Tax=Paenibacillus woosongensis TaxID=307580 RepID=A0A7X2YY86_9BACL|nr:FtsX-like permease family protein [Paenibacillus woosongensis]MUG44047.1 FtsX-like permease family protein [Paenibacillus woosongensis]
MNFFHLILRNMLHRKFLSLLTILSVTATVAFVLLLSLSKASVEQGAQKGYGPFDVVVGAQGSQTQLVLNTFYHIGAPVGNIPGRTMDMVLEDSGVEKAYAITTGDNYNGYPIVGVNPEYFLTRYGDQKLQEGSLYSETGEVVVGAYVARMLGLRAGDTFTGAHGLVEGAHHADMDDEGHGESGEHHDDHESFIYTVKGILPMLNTPDDRAVFTTLDYAWAVHGQMSGEREITAILIKPASLLGAQGLKTKLEGMPQVQAVYTSKAVADVVNLVDQGAGIIEVVTVLCVILAAISILLSLIAAVNERTKDVGLLRLLGKSKGYVLMTLVGEGILVTAAGLVSGFLAGHAASYVLKDALFSYAGIQITPFQWSADHIIIAAATMAIGALASLGPALRLYRMDSLSLFKA